MIQVNHLSKSYTQPNGEVIQVLKDVNCHIKKGEVISIIGPSGTGKSTFLRALNLLDPPTDGEILVEGENILRKKYPLNKLRQRMGMVFQNFNLFEHLSILENVTLAPIKLLGLSKEDAQKEAMQMLRKVGMAEKADAMPKNLSGGQKQRVAIARCLAMHPDIILFDEPTSALDPTLVGEVLSVIRQLAKEGMTMLIVTHEMKFAYDVSTRIFFMNEGVIYEEGTPQQIFKNPQREATRAFTNRIRTLSSYVNSADFDIYEFLGQVGQFCMHYGIIDKQRAIEHIIDEFLSTLLKPEERPVSFTLNYSEKDYSLTLTIKIEGLEESPLARQSADELALNIVRGMSKSISEKSTPDGYEIIFTLP